MPDQQLINYWQNRSKLIARPYRQLHEQDLPIIEQFVLPLAVEWRQVTSPLRKLQSLIMPINYNQESYQLSDTRNQILFKEEIIPDAFDETAPAVTSRAIFLGGQSGSGKSGLLAAMLQTFSTAESAVIVNSDALREHHPNFTKLQTTNPQQASFLVNPNTILWQQKLIAASVETKRNLILDGTLAGDPTPILATMQRLREAGCFLQVSVLAVPAWVSQFGIYNKYKTVVGSTYRRPLLR